MAEGWYNRFKANLMNKEIDMEADTIKAALLVNTYTFDKDHDVLTDVNANETSGTGYTAGGVTLASKAVAQDDTNDRATFDAADLSWTTATFTARYLVLWDDTVAGDPLIAAFDFGSDKSVTGGTFTVVWGAQILRLT